VKEPPSRAWWELDAHINGHSPSETIAYLDWCADYEDERSQSRQRPLPMGVISPDGIEPRWLTTVRRWFGR
jgi:hypothetical protein